MSGKRESCSHMCCYLAWKAHTFSERAHLHQRKGTPVSSDHKTEPLAAVRIRMLSADYPAWVVGAFPPSVLPALFENIYCQAGCSASVEDTCPQTGCPALSALAEVADLQAGHLAMTGDACQLDCCLALVGEPYLPADHFALAETARQAIGYHALFQFPRVVEGELQLDHLRLSRKMIAIIGQSICM